MARVCPHCKTLTEGAEEVCRTCGTPTVTPEIWRAMRGTSPRVEAKPEASPAERKAEDERRIQIGLGGMAAFLLFFVVYLVAYLIAH